MKTMLALSQAPFFIRGHSFLSPRLHRVGVLSLYFDVEASGYRASGKRSPVRAASDSNALDGRQQLYEPGAIRFR